MESDLIEAGVARMVSESTQTSPTEVLNLLDLMCELAGAQAARLHIADYSLRCLQQIDRRGPVGPPQVIAGTLIGRVFTSGELQTVGSNPTVVLMPLAEGTCTLGILELDFEVWDGLPTPLLDRIVAIFVMAWIVKGRYTDMATGARRSQPYRLRRRCSGPAAAAGLLDDRVAVSGIPARIRDRCGLVRLCV